MLLDLELDDKIYGTLEILANERGISIKELIRWVIGDYVRISQGPVPYAFQDETQKMMKLSNLLTKGLINQGILRCSNCTQPLSLEDLEQGKCSKCGIDI